MNCPVCGEKMREIEKYSVELDICPGCRGVWLDRGELEKIIDMVSSGKAPVDVSASTAPQSDRTRMFRDDNDRDSRERRDYHDHHIDHDHDRHHDDHHSHGQGYGHHKRRRGWFSELFDD